MTDEQNSGDALAARTFTPLNADPVNPEAEAQAAQEQAQADAAMNAVRQNMAGFIFTALKVARKLVARKLPEILEEWTDPVLQAPAVAAVPLVERHLDRLMQLVGQSPELAAFALACIPLGVGYMNAADKHARTIEMPPSEPAAGQA